MDLIIEKIYACVLVMTCVLVFTICIAIINIIKNKREEMILHKYEIDMNIPIENEKLTNLLDSIITECFNEYLVLRIEYQQIEYLNTNMQQEIMKGVSHMIMERISPTLITKLSILYNKDRFTDLVAQKVYLQTLNYSLQKNKMIED